MSELSSRERLLRAMKHQMPDYVPCCFMIFKALRLRCHDDRYELVKAERAMGLDSHLFIPSLPEARRLDHPALWGLLVHCHPSVERREWREETCDSYPILHKEYSTPAGKLRTSVRLTEDWPHGDHIPFVDDYQVSRALKPLITGRESELDALRYLLTPPQAEDIAEFERDAERAQAFAREQGVVIAGGWGVGADMANWLCGFENLMVLEQEQPAYVIELLEMIHTWNCQRMAVVLAGKVDLFIHRAWYEGCDFVTPRFYREAILPRLKAEVALAHEHGALFGYACTSGQGPLLEAYLEAGVDVLIGLDPVQGTHTDPLAIKKKTAGRICLWGGVCAPITVEMGEEEEVRAAVRQAFEILGPQGFILSPVENIIVDAPRTWSNIQVFIDEWRRRRCLNLSDSAASHVV